MKKTASALLLAGALTFTGAGAATALDNYAPSPVGGVNDSTVAPGEAVVFSGTGFEPGEDILVTVTYTNNAAAVPGAGVNGVIIFNQQVNSFTTQANANGEFSVPVTLGEAGTYTLTATGLTSGKTITSAVEVDPAYAGGGTAPGTGTTPGAGAGSDASADGGLADTGADTGLLLWGAAGVLALGAGVASVAVARRKNA